MSIYQPIQFDVVVVLAERIYKYLGYFQPSNVKTELKANNKLIYYILQRMFNIIIRT